MKKRHFVVVLCVAISIILSIETLHCQPNNLERKVVLTENSIKAKENYHQILKEKFIEGSALFMSFIALTLVVGLAFCLERILYLNLSQVNTHKLLDSTKKLLDENNIQEILLLTSNTRGPVASICHQALIRIDEPLESIEKTVASYGAVQVGLLEKNFSWISLLIAIAPSLGFLGTVVGMIEAFDKIQQLNDINPSIVAGGMKVALITTVGGLIVALILQIFYNYILSKTNEIIHQMDSDAITLMDIISSFKHTQSR